MNAIDPHIAVLVMGGVSGSGKSTVGVALAQRLGWLYAEADDFHSPENIAKMSRGEPLTDADRAPWLADIAGYIAGICERGEHAVVSCSALKRAYRVTLVGAHREHVRIVLLVGDEAAISGRLAGRHGHFMPASLLKSQIATLELPDADEPHTLVVPIGGAVGEIVERAMAALSE